MSKAEKRPVVLTIAASDPGGGAGIQADLKTFAALKVYGYSAITAVIAQNSRSVSKVAIVDPQMVVAQIRSVVAECRPRAVKTGALGDASIVRTLAREIHSLRLPAPVVDPVMVSSSGGQLLDREGERAMRDRLIPLARIVTPNMPEAERLTGVRIEGMAEMRKAAREILRMGARAVLIKGGHLARESDATDVFHDGHRWLELRAPRVAGGGAHGTGCALSAAIAACLARGTSLDEAVRMGKRYVTAALRRSFRLGSGRPILGHFDA